MMRLQPIIETAPIDVVPVEDFQSDLQSICGLFDVEPVSARGLVTGQAVTRRLGRLDVADVSLNALRVTRNARQISRDPGDHYFAILQMDGRCLIQQADTSCLLAPGEMCIVDSSQPSEFLYNGQNSRQVSLHLPRQEMIGRFGNSFASWAHLPEAKSWFPLILSIVQRLMESRSSAARQQLEEGFLSLLGAALHDLIGEDVAPHRRETEILTRALDLIDTCCEDPMFDTKRLACALGVTSRTMQRHFKSLGETPGRRLLDARLARAYGKLTTAHQMSQSITDIAFSSGFSDLSYFHREFKEKYGMTPGELRGRA